VRIDRRPGPRPGVPAAHDIAEQTELGAVLLRSLLRAQLALALRVAAVIAVLLGGLPLTFALVPSLWTDTLVGLPVPLVVLGAGAYPVLWLAGRRFVRNAERNEADFVDVVERS
jgi:hypothetical protein